MNHDPSTSPTSRRPSKTLLIVGVIIAVAAISVGVYGLIRGTNNTGYAPESPPVTSATTPSPDPVEVSDAEVFARRVAGILFTWDTATMNPADVTEAVMTVADPTLDGEATGLTADITNYLPDAQTWATLRGYGTHQRLDVETVTVPETWDQAKNSATEDQILPGTIAYTITGTRHREGTWNGQPANYSEPVVFTMFITCAPSFPECHLMRLSMPNQPLE